MCMSVRGAIATIRNSRGEDTFLQQDDGTPLLRNEALQFLNLELAKGHNVIPVNDGCDNPCTRKGCAGFNFSEGGCPGYDVDE